MHEFGIAQGLLRVVLSRTDTCGASCVESIKLEIGVLSGIEDEALKFAFTALSRGTPAENARLIIDKIPVRCHCRACGRSFDCSPLAYECPDCGTASSDLEGGNEMNLVSMEVQSHV